jgi:hypothetical protein
MTQNKDIQQLPKVFDHYFLDIDNFRLKYAVLENGQRGFVQCSTLEAISCAVQHKSSRFERFYRQISGKHLNDKNKREPQFYNETSA